MQVQTLKAESGRVRKDMAEADKELSQWVVQLAGMVEVGRERVGLLALKVEDGHHRVAEAESRARAWEAAAVEAVRQQEELRTNATTSTAQVSDLEKHLLRQEDYVTWFYYLWGPHTIGWQQHHYIVPALGG